MSSPGHADSQQDRSSVDVLQVKLLNGWTGWKIIFGSSLDAAKQIELISVLIDPGNGLVKPVHNSFAVQLQSASWQAQYQGFCVGLSHLNVLVLRPQLERVSRQNQDPGAVPGNRLWDQFWNIAGQLSHARMTLAFQSVEKRSGMAQSIR
jgi:hypothetical protein